MEIKKKKKRKVKEIKRNKINGNKKKQNERK